jgi:hypothetical protein
MLHCVMIVGQIFLVGGNGVPVNFSAYSHFTAEESWDEYYIVAYEYDGSSDRYKVEGVITNEMIPSILNHCATVAQNG